MVWYSVAKSTGLKSVKPGTSSHFSESREPSYVSSAMCPECPAKDWRRKSFWLQSTNTRDRPKVHPGTRWRDYISDLAWSCLGVEPVEVSEIAVDREIFGVLLGLLPPRLSPKEKQAPKWVNEWVCRPTLNPSIYDFVFSLCAKSKCRIQISIYGRELAFLWNSVRSIRHTVEGKMVLTP